MSVQPDYNADDLDRTEELPVLDVEAYEASLEERDRTLSRTEAWSNASLDTGDDDGDSSRETLRPFDAEALTVNVAHILNRIAELEADVEQADEANAALAKQTETLEAERDQLSGRIRTLEAENARLSEHRTLTEEMARRLEGQLRGRVERVESELKALQATHAAELSRAALERGELERLRAAAATREAELADRTDDLEERLQASQALADQRAQALAAVEKSLHDEKARTAHVARQLAAKLADCERLSSGVEQRSRTVDDLTQRLERETTARSDLASRLTSAERNLGEARILISQRDEIIDSRDRETAALREYLERTRAQLEAAASERDVAQQRCSQLESSHSEAVTRLRERDTEACALRASLEAAERREIGLQKELSALRQASLDEEHRRIEIDAQLKTLQQELASAVSHRDATQAELRELAAERETLIASSAHVATLNQDFETARAELARAQRELASAHEELERRSQSLQQTMDELSIEHARCDERAAQIRELERALAARDEAAQTLALQLQTGRDEWNAMAGQLDKSRARIKALTQHIFSRDHEIAQLQADLAVHTEALAAIRRDVNRIGTDDEGESVDDLEPVLEPMDHAGPPIVLNGAIFTIGRTTDNDICIPSTLISRRHARLLVGPTGVIVEDAGSTNGCFVNGEQVRQHLMHDGDVLELGNRRYRLRTRSDDTVARATPVPTLTNVASLTGRRLTVVPTLIEGGANTESNQDIP